MLFFYDLFHLVFSVVLQGKSLAASWPATFLLTFSIWSLTYLPATNESFNPFIPTMEVVTGMVAMTGVECLFFSKFSIRYTKEHIKHKVRKKNRTIPGNYYLIIAEVPLRAIRLNFSKKLPRNDKSFKLPRRSWMLVNVLYKLKYRTVELETINYPYKKEIKH